MAEQTEKLIIEFTGRPEGGEQVVIDYEPITREAGAGERMMAVELALHALAQDAIRGRQAVGMAVPAILLAVVETGTFRELM
ncbi:MAG: hypothetical protein IT210_11765 [Armatimonadetes bacterium]|nr:hypothetical protein [Armatimonadota bacterium]